MFETFDLSAVPRKKRNDALYHRIRASSPFKEFDYNCNWHDGRAAVWIWEKEKQISLAKIQGANRKIALRCESAVINRKTESFVAVKGIEGYIIQIWDSERLVAEGAWLKEPSSQDLQWFFESNFLSRPLEPLVWEEISFQESLKTELLERPDAFKRLALTILLASFCFSLSHELVSMARIAFSAESHRAEILKEKEDKRELVGLRAEATEAIEFTKSFPELKAIAQVTIMAKIAEALGQEKNNLIEWNFEGNIVKALFQKAQNSPESLVEKLEGTGLFASIEIEIDAIRDRVLVNMEVVDETQ